MTEHSSIWESGSVQRKRVRIGDFMRDGLDLETRDDRLTLDDTLIEGRFLHRELRQGLVIHGGDVIEERAFTATSLLREGLSCIFFLDGQVELNVGDKHMDFNGSSRRPMKGAAIMSTTQERFQRISRERQHVRHVVISVTPEWLDMDGFEEVGSSRLAALLLNNHLAESHWLPTPRLCEVIRQILAPSIMMPSLHNLFLESRCIEIVAETVAAMLNTDREQQNDTLTRRELIRLERAKEIISLDNTAMNVEAIARGAGISASGLQRLFRVSEGCSVFEYVRKARLERAFIALQSGELSVNEASLLAGYSSPENFATAFRRQYGIRPRDMRKTANHAI
ncbi:AraC family transcriptional regulator [Phyllobacterium sp. SB3]|uniref:helix-turn-helix domain-containing protein n=1 Tax=Phyllobacterium sp. SB3 TaxID=3156073 RepID=UPI0032B0068F